MFKRSDYKLDCEQSLSFPRVFLAFLRASVELWSSEQRAAKPRDARARRKRKKKESVFFLSLPIPSSFLSLICIILMSSARGGFQEQKPTTRSLITNAHLKISSRPVCRFQERSIVLKGLSIFSPEKLLSKKDK